MPFMEEDPSNYRSFIQEYQDRILYGSDAFIGNPGAIKSSVLFMERLLQGPELFHTLVNTNYKLFHGHVGQNAPLQGDGPILALV